MGKLQGLQDFLGEYFLGTRTSKDIKRQAGYINEFAPEAPKAYFEEVKRRDKINLYAYRVLGKVIPNILSLLGIFSFYKTGEVPYIILISEGYRIVYQTGIRGGIRDFDKVIMASIKREKKMREKGIPIWQD